MFFFRKKEEVFLTNNVEAFVMVQQALKREQIPYDTKTVNTGSANRRTGEILGSIGEDLSLQIMYYIYTAPDDVQKAQHAISEYQKNKNNL